jgi:hypothetical protein
MWGEKLAFICFSLQPFFVHRSKDKKPQPNKVRLGLF